MAAGEILERGLRRRVRWMEGGGQGRKEGVRASGRKNEPRKEINREGKRKMERSAEGRRERWS